MTKKKKPNIYHSDHGNFAVVVDSNKGIYSLGVRGGYSHLSMSWEGLEELHSLLDKVLASE